MQEDNTREIAIQIFSRPPRPRNSIQLNLESNIELNSQEEIDLFILNVLSLITLHGIEVLFGHTDIMRLTEADYFLIQEYTESYGYQIIKRFDPENNLIVRFEKVY